jgi:FkbH-like protein
VAKGGVVTATTTAGVDARRRGRIKCVVWDLDNTVWDGVLLEDRAVTVRQQVVDLIRALDARGILNSVASRNDHDAAMDVLEREGLAELFLFPQISWNPKSQAIATIAREINIGVDSIAFVDDQEFELAEVAHAHADVFCVNADAVDGLLDLPEFTPARITDESGRRRELYRAAIARRAAEASADGVDEGFLATLDMVFSIAPAAEDDLARAEELTVRTNQLNSTGVTYSYDELDALRRSPDHLLLVASLSDRFGSYGKIGLALVDLSRKTWRLRMLLMSCRVMSRGVGTVMLGEILRLAADRAEGLRAEFTDTGRNRIMYVTYRFAGFSEVAREGDTCVLGADLSRVPPRPAYVRVELDGMGG